VAAVGGDALHFDISSMGLNAADFSAGVSITATEATIDALGVGGAANHIMLDTAANIATFTNADAEYSGAAIAVETDTGKVLFDADADFSAGSIVIGTLTVAGTLDLNNFDIIA